MQTDKKGVQLRAEKERMWLCLGITVFNQGTTEKPFEIKKKLTYNAAFSLEWKTVWTSGNNIHP